MNNTGEVIEQNASYPPTDRRGINAEIPQYPNYAIYSKRMESFEKWPEYSPVKKEDLVEAGLISIGAGDCCLCYHCGGGLKNWQPGDDPMRKHAELDPKCPHVLLVKGQAYIDAVRNGEMNGADNYLETPACLSCLQNGYPRDMVQKAVQLFISINKHSDFKGTDICKIMMELENSTLEN